MQDEILEALSRITTKADMNRLKAICTNISLLASKGILGEDEQERKDAVNDCKAAILLIEAEQIKRGWNKVS